jgi:hypothetical protein
MKKSILLHFLLASLSIALSACGSAGNGTTEETGAPYYIYAKIFSTTSTVLDPRFKNATVHIEHTADGTPVDDALVSVNGNPLSFSARLDYEGSVWITPGESVVLTVLVSGQTYTVSTNQFSQYPTITSPVTFADWDAPLSHDVNWTGGAPTEGASYGLGVLSSSDQNGNLVWPPDGSLKDISIGTNSFTIPPSTLVDGYNIILAMIKREIPISGAASGSSLVIGGFGAVEIYVRHGILYAGTPENTELAYTAIGDLNGDGLSDVAVTEASGTRILLYYQNADGALGAPQTVTADLTMTGIAIKDVNNDGFADLIISGNSTTSPSGPLGRIAVFRQSPGSHTLGSPEYLVLSANDVRSLASADMNSDGFPDIVTAGTRTDGGSVISFFYQDGSGGLLTEATYTHVPVYSNSPSPEMHVGDMNHDGKNDIVLRNGLAEIAVIKQVAPGQFSSTPDLYTVKTTVINNLFASFTSFALGDLNGDGRTDIAIADWNNQGALIMFIQNSNGTLDVVELLPWSVSTGDEIKIVDMNGDGLNDIVNYWNGASAFEIYHQAPDHSFMDPLIYSTAISGEPSVIGSIVIGDVNNDTVPDMVASWWNDNGLYVYPRKP